MKKLMKRSLSVLMAALMLLTAWVFIAPEKAQAVDAGTYYVTFTWDVTNKRDSNDNWFGFWYTKPDGTVEYKQNTDASRKENNGQTIQYALSGVPTKFDYRMKATWDGGSEWYLTRIDLADTADGSGAVNTVLWAGKLGAGQGGGVGVKARDWRATFDLTKGKAENALTYGNGDQANASPESTSTTTSSYTRTSRPAATTIEVEDLVDEIQIPKYSGQTNYGAFKFQVFDQFGIRLGSSAYKIDCPSEDEEERSSSSVVGQKDPTKSGTDYEYWRIAVNTDAKRLADGTRLKAPAEEFLTTLDLTITLNSIGTVTPATPLVEKLMITLFQPVYTVTYTDAASGSTISPASIPGTYSMPIEEIPDPDRRGYTPLGFFKNSGEHFTNSDTAPSSWGAQVTDETIVTGDVTYYAGWSANPCVVTVQNNARQTKYVYTGRYGQKLGDVSSPSYPGINYLINHLPYVRESSDQEYNTMQVYDLMVVEAEEYISSSETQPVVLKETTSLENWLLTGDITVRAVAAPVKSAYSVNFYAGSTTPIGGTKTYNEFKAQITPPADPSFLPSNAAYDYVFAGWAKQRKSTDTFYEVDVVGTDDAGNPILSTSVAIVDPADMIVTQDLNYVAVYARTYKEFSADFIVKIDGGEEQTVSQVNAYHYMSHIIPPSVDSYVYQGYTYNFDGWYTARTGGKRVSFNNPEANNATLGYYSESFMDLTNVEARKTYYARYTRGDATMNLIEFYTEDGELLVSQEVAYNTEDNTSVPALRAEAEAKLKEKELDTYDTATVRREFSDWVNKRGGTETAYSAQPLAPAAYYVKYRELPLRTISLHNGDQVTYSYIGVAGDTLETDKIADGIQNPTRVGDAYAESYQFAGWSTGEGYLHTEGETLISLGSVTIADKDIALYAHYDCEPTPYKVGFYTDETKATELIPVQELKFGDKVTIPELTEAQKTKASDDTYEYKFMGWNLEPSESCVGNMDYYLSFRENYRYYTVKWMNYAADRETATVYKSEQYVYNEVIRSPYNAPEAPASTDASQVNVLSGWTYADGSNYVAGHRMTKDHWDNGTNVITLTPHYALQTRTVTVNKYDNIPTGDNIFGTVIGTEKVAYGTLYSEFVQTGSLGEYTPRYTATSHYRFSRWQLISNGVAVNIGDDYAFTNDVSIVASYTAEGHDRYWDNVITKDPSFSAAGEYTRTCTFCKYKSGVIEIPILQDTTAPLGRLYVNNHSWIETPEFNDQNPIPAAMNNMIILTAADAADSADDMRANGDFNENGIGSGVKSISFAVVRRSAANNPSAIRSWHTAYSYDSKVAPNASLTLKNLMDTGLFDALTSESKFVIVAKIEDNATEENVPENEEFPNVSYLCSDVLVYDTTEPTIKITSSDKMTASIRHCVDATITIADKDLASVTLNGNTTWTVDGEEKDLKTLVASGLKITDKGQYQVVATDLAGNASMANFTILGSHNLADYAIAATCTTPGTIAQRCTTCGQLMEDAQTIPAKGHTMDHRTIAATCTEDGSEYDYCIVCGWIDTTTEKTLPHSGHDFPDLAEGYTLIAAKCTSTGMKRVQCRNENCGQYLTGAYGPLDPDGTKYQAELERDLAEDEVLQSFGHSFYRDETKPATCTAEGKVIRTCKYCLKDFTVETLNKIPHTPDPDHYEVVTPATCETDGVKTPYCKVCGTLLTDDPNLTSDDKKIAATGHQWGAWTTVQEPTEAEEGVKRRVCANDASHVETDKIEKLTPTTKYTVTLYNVALDADGKTVETLFKTLPDVVAGTTLNKSDLGEPTQGTNTTYEYDFVGWSTELPDLKKALDDKTTPETENSIVVNADKTLYAVYDVQYVLYEIKLYKDTGEFIRNDGYHHYGEKLAPSAPAKAEDEYGTYEFKGWIDYDYDPASGYDPIYYNEENPITVTKDGAKYKAQYVPASEKSYTVIWRNEAGETIYEKTVKAGKEAKFDGTIPTTNREITAEGHWIFAGWDQDTSKVLQTMFVNPTYKMELHNEITERTTLSCTSNAGYKTYCLTCGYVIAEEITQRTTGHDWKPSGDPVYPVIHADGSYDVGSQLYKCSECGETKTEELLPIDLDVTVKDTNGKLIEGAKVTAYDGDKKIMSANSGSDGVAHLRVPQAKTYRIVVEYGGKTLSGDMMVDEKGNITGGSTPTIDASTGACPKSCTCHKSGTWAQIYRFFHTIIYFLTRTKCCPDATYLR